MDSSFEDKVRERAYHIWMAAGRESGLADLHWLSAEQEVMDEITSPNAKVVKSKARAAKPIAATPIAASPIAAMPKRQAAPRKKGA